MNRREFLFQTAAATSGLACLNRVRVFAESTGVTWPIGCFNRAWSKWGIDAALDGIKGAGYTLAGLLTRTKADPFVGSDSTPEYLQALKTKIAARNLKANLGTIYARTNLPYADAVRDLHRQIDNAKTLELEYLMNFGVDRPEEYEAYYKLMADASAYAQERALKVVLKPHGGGSGASEEILRCIKKINHPNFSIWYDAGNIIYYTGKDPVTELDPIAQYVTGFCAKDCAQPKGEVMVQLGTGKVDFKRVFSRLKTAGFHGPIMLEGSNPGKSPDEATANAKANREFLERILASL
ncbi:MAG TPA: sugar phosphate isomerase/epimerase [Verrucomicrobiae bacterium]|nr:sugar phosphate isomerase/epimerase [Verrucomicrobiae bacterium]